MPCSFVSVIPDATTSGRITFPHGEITMLILPKQVSTCQSNQELRPLTTLFHRCLLNTKHRHAVSLPTSVRLSQPTTLQLNTLALKVSIEHMRSVVVHNNPRFSSKDIPEITPRRGQCLHPRIPSDVPFGRFIHADVNRRRAVDPAFRVTHHGPYPDRVAAEFPCEVCRILCPDISHNCRLGHQHRDAEWLAKPFGEVGVACGVEQDVRCRSY